MARVCVRPGCDRPAVARLSYDTITCQVWLDSVPEWPGPVQEICQLHASRLTVPRGWTLRDRRIEAGHLVEARLFDVPDEPEAPAVAAPVVAVRSRVAATRPVPGPSGSEEEAAPAPAEQAAHEPTPPEPVAEPVAEPVGEPVPEPVAEPAAQLDDADGDLPEELQATSPLLARAFRSTGPQRSVLTQTVAEQSNN